MAPTLLIDLFLEERFLISNLCTFLGHSVEWAKIALLFLHVTSQLFQFTISHMSGYFYIRLSKNFLKRFTNEENDVVLFMESL